MQYSYSLFRMPPPRFGWLVAVLLLLTTSLRAQEYAYQYQIGAEVPGITQFRSPSGVAVDGSGNVYVADQSNNRIVKLNPDGSIALKFGTRGSGDGQFQFPRGVAVDASGNIYVADVNNNRIQK